MNFMPLCIIFLQISTSVCEPFTEKDLQVFKKLNKRETALRWPADYSGTGSKGLRGDVSEYTVPGGDPGGDSSCRDSYCPKAFRCWYQGLIQCCWPSVNHEQCKDGGACFPSTTKVNLENGKSVMMSELQVGDRVQTGDKYSEVKTFMKKEPTVRTKYQLITTSVNKTIHLSEHHLIYARAGSTNKFYPIYADAIAINDEVLVLENTDLIPEKVTNVSSFMMQGAFTPLTMNGNIMVDGVLASCYAFSDHDVAHIGTTLIRWFPEVIEWIFGQEDNASPAYLDVAHELVKWMLPHLV